MIFLNKYNSLFTSTRFPFSFSLPIVLLSALGSKPKSHTAFCYCLFVLSFCPGEFIIPSSFMILTLRRSTGQFFVDGLSFWLCLIFFHAESDVWKDYHGKDLLPRLSGSSCMFCVLPENQAFLNKTLVLVLRERHLEKDYC